MVIWKIEGDQIGHNDASASFFETKSAADWALKTYRSWCKEIDKYDGSVGPTKIVISNRTELADALNKAMGHGGN